MTSFEWPSFRRLLALCKLLSSGTQSMSHGSERGGELVTVLLLVVGDEWSNIIVNRAVLGQQKVQTREGSSHLIGALMTEGMFDFIIKYRITSTTLHSSTHCTRRIKGPVVLWPRDNYPHLFSVSSFL